MRSSAVVRAELQKTRARFQELEREHEDALRHEENERNKARQFIVAVERDGEILSSGKATGESFGEDAHAIVSRAIDGEVSLVEHYHHTWDYFIREPDRADKPPYSGSSIRYALKGDKHSKGLPGWRYLTDDYTVHISEI